MANMLTRTRSTQRADPANRSHGHFHFSDGSVPAGRLRKRPCPGTGYDARHLSVGLRQLSGGRADLDLRLLGGAVKEETSAGPIHTTISRRVPCRPACRGVGGGGGEIKVEPGNAVFPGGRAQRRSR